MSASPRSAAVCASELRAPALSVDLPYNVQSVGNSPDSARMAGSLDFGTQVTKVCPYRKDTWLFPLAALARSSTECPPLLLLVLAEIIRSERVYNRETSTSVSLALWEQPSLAVQLYENCLAALPAQPAPAQLRLAFFCKNCCCWLNSMDAFLQHRRYGIQTDSCLHLADSIISTCDGNFLLPDKPELGPELGPEQLSKLICFEPEIVNEVASLSSTLHTIRSFNDPRVCAKCKQWIACSQYIDLHHSNPAFCYRASCPYVLPRLFHPRQYFARFLGAPYNLPFTPLQNLRLFTRHVVRCKIIHRFTKAFLFASLSRLSRGPAHRSLPSAIIHLVEQFLGLIPVNLTQRAPLATPFLEAKLTHLFRRLPWLIAQ